ncbi:quinone oxidoreductase family protein [Pseudomonas xantholysinigenes]|uniref:Quinone oxidoreductase n=1 Tax=Pseudomonas xantholysinigenes TaxID=2745490 RepID=A0A9E6PUI7_9PSED|nr:quinone oxidoreductase [Pseudomonas xantholysinigenes]QXI37877.1 quinone oxidoreductase [Pseudomonas xantholysinigenes]
MTRATAVMFDAPGNPEVLYLHEQALPALSDGQVLVAIQAAGVNFIDTYRRSGALDDGSAYPRGLGTEGAGEVIARAPDVTELKVGDRVAFIDGSSGSYASHAIVPAARVIRLDPEISFETAAAVMFKGITAEYLTHRCVPLMTGDWVLWHAAAGGVGSIATSWLAARGMKVIGLASTPAKRQAALNAGCIAALDNRDTSTLQAIRELTDGRGVDVAFDSIGKDTVEFSLASLRRRGQLVLFGNASGDVTGFNLSRLGALGSLHVTRPTLKHYVAERDELRMAARRVMDALKTEQIKVPRITSHDMADAGQVHQLLHDRQTLGALILRP